MNHTPQGKQRVSASSTKPLTGFVFILCVALVGQCLGAGIALFREGSVFAEVLWQVVGLNDRLAYNADRYAYLTFVLVSLGGLWIRRPTPLVWLGFWFLLLAGMELCMGGSFSASYAPLAYAVRYACPWALALLMCQSFDGSQRKIYALLSYSIATVFAVHGIEALQHHPTFVDYLIRVGRNYAGILLSEETAGWILYAIGTQDLCLSLAVMIRPRAALFAYMAFWGLLTAAARVFYSPHFGWPAALVRATNAGVPLALYWGIVTGLFSPSMQSKEKGGLWRWFDRKRQRRRGPALSCPHLVAEDFD